MPKVSKSDIIFTGFPAPGSLSDGLNIDEFGESESNLDLNSNGDYHDPAISLDVLKTMVSTILASDSHLFTRAERNVLLSFRDLSVKAQHLFVFLAIHPKWHRIQSLQSVEDVPWGDLACAIAELCRPISDYNPILEAACEIEVKLEVKHEPVDPSLKMEEDGPSALVYIKKEEPKLAGPSDDIPIPQSQPNAIAGSSTSLFPFPRPDPKPSSLCIDDSQMTLRQLVEYMGLNEQRMIASQLKIKPGKKKMELIESILTTSSKQTNLMDFFSKSKAKAAPSSQEERLREMILKHLRKLIRIDEDVFEVLMRAHLRYFLPCEFPTEIIPRPLRHLQRKYPDYVCKRSENIWENRETLIEYHDSLRAEAKIAGVLPSGIQPDLEPSSEEMQPGKRKRPTADGVEVVKDKNAAAIRKATVTQTLFEEVFKRWASHYGVKAQSDSVDPGLERFEPGYVLTRATHKGANVFKVLKDDDSESDILDILLAQREWCRGLRGAWHTRKSGILLEKIKDGAPGKAMKVTRNGIADRDTGLIYRHSLITNLAKLQKRLPSEDELEISEPTKVPKITFSATRIPNVEKKQPSLWKTKNNEEGTIQALVSQHYETKFDFERVQPGGCLLTTLFTLLFWDIIFMPMNGVFETAFQTCPLDLCEDTFLSSRRDAIFERLDEIKDGRAGAILKKHDAEHRGAKKTVVGVRWDLCSRKQLVEIVKCISGATLRTICQMFCEDYVEACLGSPDLIAWDVDGENYKLLHIKGPGYPGRQNKKAWRDVLARGDAKQEICEVVELGKAKKKKGKKKDAESGSDSADDELEPDSEEESFWHPNDKAANVLTRSSNSDEEDEYQPKNPKRRKLSRE
ncbi:hypothetical protein C8F04DRAFT_42431 [Mycena alexandri]|uniref:Fanconi-associated nuclease n=1 Tax=Mycena alexandri TaxID=1745969 RepID=A0AAD6SPC9_9AGAR|nr:hypothetical protein C8F04DRAFT_42431 [Mycena alexandri]